jgi:hypothetical protein
MRVCLAAIALLVLAAFVQQLSAHWFTGWFAPAP